MHLDKAKNNEGHYSTEQKRAKEIEVIASLCSPKCVNCQAHYHYCCQYCCFQYHFPCFTQQQQIYKYYKNKMYKCQYSTHIPIIHKLYQYTNYIKRIQCPWSLVPNGANIFIRVSTNKCKCQVNFKSSQLHVKNYDI